MTTNDDRTPRASAARRIAATAAALLALAAAACSSYHSSILLPELAERRLSQNILVLPPVSEDSNLDNYCEELGGDFHVEVARHFTKAKAIYGPKVKSLMPSLTWSNLVINGRVNRHEVAEMAKELGCSSAIASNLLSVSHYPPFKTVIESEWIDAESGETIASVYNDVDLSDDKTKHIYSVYIGGGPLKMLQEEYVTYYKDHLQTAMLSPAQFRKFVAAYTVQLMIGKAGQGFWHRFWNIF